MGSWISDYLEYTKTWESPTSFHEATALSVLAGAVERKVWIPQGNSGIYPNLYLILVGPPASRKSTAALLGAELLERVEGIGALAADVITKEAMYDEMEEVVKRFEWDGDIIQHTSYTVVSTEWGMFLPEKDMPFVLALIKLYDCEKRFKKGTRTQGKNLLPNVYFNMIGCIQPKKLGEVLPKSAIGSGFTSRIIFVVEHGPRFDEPSPTLDVKREAGLVARLNEIHKLTGPFKWARDADAWFDEWYRTKRNDSPLVFDERFLHYIHRKPQHLMKIAMLMHVSRVPSLLLEVEDFEVALRWLNKVEKNMSEAYGSYGMSRHAEMTETIRRFIRAKRMTTTQEVLRHYFRDITAKDLREVVETLATGGHIRVKMVAGDTVELRWNGE